MYSDGEVIINNDTYDMTLNLWYFNSWGTFNKWTRAITGTQIEMLRPI